MGRVISTENLATDRTRLMKAMALALPQLARQPGFNTEARDLAAFLVLALDGISASVERSVLPWEKRGYWLKADRFRMDWAWVQPNAQELRAALINDDIGGVAVVVAKLAARLKDIEVPAKHRLGTPWVGAWDKMTQKAK
jgi:hypothetical protein